MLSHRRQARRTTSEHSLGRHPAAQRPRERHRAERLRNGAAKTPRKAAISAWIGSALEYYDFFIYGTAAALIFPKLFFPAGNPTAATIASLATFGVAYVARPIGSFIMGHLGDTIGRKTVLTITLFGMGIATFLIGVCPPMTRSASRRRSCC